MRTMFCLAALAAASGPAYAGDPKFEYGKADEVAKVAGTEWDAAAELGVVFTTGNSETTTLAAGVKASRKTGQNKLAVEGSVTYARAGQLVLNDRDGNGTIDDATEIQTITAITAETLAGKIRYDRFLTAHNSLFVAALASRDLPAGKESVVGAQLGYSRQLYKSAHGEAVGEFGYDYSHENLVKGPPLSIHSGRAFVGYKGELAPGAALDTSLEVLTNFNHEDLATRKDGAGFAEDTRVNGKAAIAAKIGANLAFQSSIEMRFDNRPAPLALKNLNPMFVPEASSFDTIMKVSLIYTFIGKR
jgi:putative salt-induced outer membrane protein